MVSARAVRPPPALVCRLYSEDKADGERDFAALEQIVRGMLRLIEERSKSNHIECKPVGRGISGPCWKSARSKDLGVRQKRMTLLKEIATELARGHVVFFHVDGDCTWAETKRAPVWAELKRFCDGLRDLAVHKQIGKLDQSMLADAFIAVIPFYSMESWIYACTERLCTRTSNAKDLERIAEWAADLGTLDEVRYIKDALSIGDQCNHELAGHVPAAALCAAGKSYAATVERVRGSSRIEAGLAETLQRDW